MRSPTPAGPAPSRLPVILAGLLCTATLPALGLQAQSSRSFSPGDDIITPLRALQAGDEVVLRGGIYTLTSRFQISGVGTREAPIVVRAAEGEVPVITRPDANQNTINVEGAAHLQLVGLEVRGGSHGIRMRDARFVTVRDCHIHDTGDVAISANYGGERYEGLHIVGNHIHDTGGTGEGMYLGCNDAACAMFDSVIEFNHVHDTLEGTSQGDGIEIKRGSFDNIVRHNVIHDTRYPCILVYGSEEGGSNLLEGNLLWGCGDHGIQAAADTDIFNNILLGAAQDGIYSRAHQSASPGNLRIAHNTVLNTANAIRIESPTGPVLVANNALYSQNSRAVRVGGDGSTVTVTGNVGTGGLQGVAGGLADTGERASDFVDAAQRDVFPAPGSALAGAADPARVLERDFNGSLRAGQADVGAYRADPAGNPGWPAGPGFKQLLEDSGPLSPTDGTDEPAPTDGAETNSPGDAGPADNASSGDQGETATEDPSATGDPSASLDTVGAVADAGPSGNSSDDDGTAPDRPAEQDVDAAVNTRSDSGSCKVGSAGGAWWLLGGLLLYRRRRAHR